MGMEIEAKFRLHDPKAMRERLGTLGALPLGRVLEHNTFFDTEDSSLRAGDRGLRLRLIEPDSGPRSALLTYKGPRQAGPFKARQEEQTEVESAEAAMAILAAMGYAPRLFFQKFRESFQLGPARIELDELPELGHFLEIEAPCAEDIQAARHALGLDDEPVLHEAYTGMIAQRLTGRNGPAELRFQGNYVPQRHHAPMRP
jgi:adenylate cyclase, class 2